MGLFDVIPLDIWNSSLSMSVKTVAHWFENNFFKRLTYGLRISCFVRDPAHRIGMCRIKSLCKIDRGGPHVDAPFPVLLIKQSVCHQMVCGPEASSKPSLIWGIKSVKLAVKPVVKPVVR